MSKTSLGQPFAAVVVQAPSRGSEMNNTSDDAFEMKVERPQTTLRALTLEKLRNAILDHHFKPGDRLVERTLCDALGVSRSIVREALRHLETEGLVETSASQRPVVARPKPGETRQIYEIRAVLEGMAAFACAQNATEDDVIALQAALDRIRDARTDGAVNTSLSRIATNDFYQILFAAGNKLVALSIVETLYARISFLRSLTVLDPGRNKSGPEGMQRIVDAVREKNPKVAEEAAIAHVRAAGEIAERVLSEASAAQISQI